MSPDQEDDRTGELPEPLLAVVGDPSLGRQRLPYLLGLLESEDVRYRLTASWAVCLVAETDDDLFEYVVRRLVDRLDEDSPIEVRHALDYLAARDAGGVDDVLVDIVDEKEVRARRLMYQTGGGFARNEYLARTEGDRPLGRTRIASGAGETGPRRVYTSEVVDEPEWLDDETDDGTDADGDDDTDDGTGADANAGVGGAAATGSETGLTSGRIAQITDRLSAILADSRFDDLEVLAERERRRYADVYRTVGTVNDDQEAVALALYRLPGEGRQSFLRAFDAAMGYWSEVDDHRGLVTVYDWGWDPHPWAAMEYANFSLEDREPLDPTAAVRNAVELANAVSHAHQHGVVHAAIDPTNVVYYGNVLTEDDGRRPLLSNVGLTSLYRGYVEPESILHVCYAAPEYFDERFGTVDGATDVYGLGTVLYRLCTGRDPFTGSPEAVREQVLTERVPPPSSVEDEVPAALDQVVRKATARRKLKRYETVRQFQRELRSVGGIDGG